MMERFFWQAADTNELVFWHSNKISPIAPSHLILCFNKNNLPYWQSANISNRSDQIIMKKMIPQIKNM